jgi:hypothetical protein
MLFSLVGHTNLIWNTNSIKMFYEISKINETSHEIALSIQTSNIFSLRINMNPN